MSSPSPQTATVAYLAPEGFVDPIVAALGSHVVSVRDRLVLASKPSEEAAWWSANIWHELEWRPIESIGDAAKALRKVQRNWALYPTDSFRRASLIESQLPPLRTKARDFPMEVPPAPMGAWTLWEKDLLLASARCASPFANGAIEFSEHKSGPPSRAYLKLWRRSPCSATTRAQTSGASTWARPRAAGPGACRRSAQA